MTAEHKAIRLRRSRIVHAAHVDDLRRAVCGVTVDGGVLDADQVPTCKRCLAKLALG